MSDYTPATAEIREAFIYWCDDAKSARARVAQGDEFDAWLAAHDAEVAAATLEDAAIQIDALGSPSGEVTVSSYWIRTYAKSIS